MKIHYLALLPFLVISNSWSYECSPAQTAKALGCVRDTSWDNECKQNYGENYLAFKSDIHCSTDKLIAEQRSTLPSRLAGRVRSLSDEIDTILTMVDNQGKKALDIFTFKPAVVKTFKESHIKALLGKMLELREQLYLLTINPAEMNSPEGKEAVVYSARFYSFMGRIHQILASAAHQHDSSNLSYSLLKRFTMKLDKRVGLELLARMNVKARHLNSNTLLFTISEEEKQSFEFNVLQSPSTKTEYAKLVQFMSIKEYLTNRWALSRISSAPLKDDLVNFCGPKMLSFEMGKSKSLASLPISQEFDAYDAYFNIFPEVTANIHKNLNTPLLSITEARSLVAKVFSSIPTMTNKLLNEYGWFDYEIEEWGNDIASALVENEQAEWDKLSETILKLNSFSGDKLNSSAVEKRLIEDSYNIRRDAIIAMMNFMLDEVTKEEQLTALKKTLSELEKIKANWDVRLSASLRAPLARLDDFKSFKIKNYKEKVSSMRAAVLPAISSAYFTELHMNAKLPANYHVKDLEPKSALELTEYFQYKLSKDSTLDYVINNSSTYRSIMKSFFESVQTRFEKLPSKKSDSYYQSNLYAIANSEARNIFKKYPGLSREQKLKMDVIERTKPAADGVYVAGPGSIIIKTPVDQKAPKGIPLDATKKVTKSAKPVAQQDNTIKLASISNFHVAVADKTSVHMKKINTKLKASKEYKTNAVNLAYSNELADINNFVEVFLGKMGLTKHKDNARFLDSLDDQLVMSNLRLSVVYQSTPMIKIPLTRKEIIQTRGADGLNTRQVVSEKPALIRMLAAFKLNKDGSSTIDIKTVDALVKETISEAFTNIKGKAKVVCESDYRNYSSDKNFKDLFRSATFLRMNLANNEALSAVQSNKLKKLEADLKKETRYFHEMINEDYIEPMMNVATTLFIISAIIIPVLGAAGVLAPGSFLLLMAFIDGADLAITGASLYFRTVSTFYEIPAQLKFQKSLATSQIDNFQFTTWDDYNTAASSHKTQQVLSLAFMPLEAVVGTQFYYSTKHLLGYTGKHGLTKLGKATRGFGTPPETIYKQTSLKNMIKNKGLVKGTISKTKEKVSSLKYYLPRYQEYTHDQLSRSLRQGIVHKASQMMIADKPWELASELKDMLVSSRARLTLNSDLGKAMSAELTLRELINKPLYANALLVPFSLIRAANRGKLGPYLGRHGGLIEGMNKLRARFLDKKVKSISVISDKLLEVEKMAKAGQLQATGKENWMDYFQSILNDEELHLLYQLSKSSSGKMHEFKSIFKAHKDVMEYVVPTVTLDGRVAGKSAKALTQVVSDQGAEVEDAQSDLVNFYFDMISKDGTSSIEDVDIKTLRINIENQLF